MAHYRTDKASITLNGKPLRSGAEDRRYVIIPTCPYCGEHAEDRRYVIIPTCPYCGEHAELVTGDVIYPHRPDLAHKRFWQCAPCDAYVGCHAPNKKHGHSGMEPLGRLADADLRRWKSKAHAAFDPLWRNKAIFKKRSHAYAWLSKTLDVPGEQCHIGMFDIAQCVRVVEVCREKINEYEFQE